MGNVAFGFLNSRTKAISGETAENLHTLDLTILYRLNSFDEPIGYNLGAGLTLAWAEVRGGVVGTGPFTGSAVPVNLQFEIDYAPEGVFALYAALVTRLVLFQVPTTPVTLNPVAEPNAMQSHAVLRVGARFWL